MGLSLPYWASVEGGLDGTSPLLIFAYVLLWGPIEAARPASASGEEACGLREGLGSAWRFMGS